MPGGMVVFMLLDKGVFHPDPLAKYLAAFFRISRSSVTRRNSSFSFRISLRPVALLIYTAQQYHRIA